MEFVWDLLKEKLNKQKHNVDFNTAKLAFKDPLRLIAIDKTHSTKSEQRFFCFGKIKDGIITVRFTYRNNKIRIIGAGFWRKGRKAYERENQIY